MIEEREEYSVRDRPIASKKRSSVEIEATIEKYARGPMKQLATNSKHKNLRKTLSEQQERMYSAAVKNAMTEVLLPSESGIIEMQDGEKVFKIRQRDMIPQLDLNTAKNAFDFQLQKFGPYNVNYSRNGRYMLFGGMKGHVAIYDCLRMKVGAELQLQEDLYDIHYLHNETLFAAAQKKYTYIYDFKGTEIHCLRNHERVHRLDYLPYHFLLTSVGHSGWIKWQDISTGNYVSGHQTGHGPGRALKHNPQNGVSLVGHGNGVVSMWSPAAGKSLVSMFCHKSPITDIAIDREGNYLATAGYDSFMKVWDLRTYKCLHAFKVDHPAMSLDISDTGLLSMAIGRTAQVLKDAFTKPTEVTYLKHEIRTPNAALSSGGGATAGMKALLSSVSTNCVRFRPLEDVLCIGHSHGITTIITPGAGEANFDARENDPFMNPKQRKEKEVQSLLNKLNHEMIGLDSSFVGTVDKNPLELQKEQRDIFMNANGRDVKADKPKNKMRGRSKISKKLQKKQKNVIDESTEKLKEKLAAEKLEKLNKKEPVLEKAAPAFDPLSRFAKKS